VENPLEFGAQKIRSRALDFDIVEAAICEYRDVISIRKANENDAQAAWEIRIAAINSQCTGHYPPESLEVWTGGEMTEQFVKTVAERFYVATLHDHVVGAGMIDLESGKIDAMCVHPGKMRTGVGRQILHYLEELALEAGLAELSLDSTLNAAPFYRACGFVGGAAATYESPRGISLDCIPMTKNHPHRVAVLSNSLSQSSRSRSLRTICRRSQPRNVT
jgi:GNAT superfamily N-acetyltransferase